MKARSTARGSRPTRSALAKPRPQRPHLSRVVPALAGGLAALAGCGSAEDTSGQAGETMTVTLGHAVSGEALALESTEYKNAAGNQYTVSRLRYFVSRIVLHPGGGEGVPVAGTHYVDAADPSTLTWTVPAVSAGTYEGLSLLIGVDPEHNKTGGLESTQENLGMAWPEPMGGGYHALKLEGHYVAPDASISGFAMHLGGDAYQVAATVPGPCDVVLGSEELRLVMDVNEWFTAPHDFDFDVDGNYTMDSDSAKQKLEENGADVFHLD